MQQCLSADQAYVIPFNANHDIAARLVQLQAALEQVGFIIMQEVSKLFWGNFSTDPLFTSIQYDQSNPVFKAFDREGVLVFQFLRDHNTNI